MKADADQPLLTAAECARSLALTPRALRVYEARGLISPKRTAKNWRVYGKAELARLNEILVLRQLGFTLAGISRILGGRATDLDRLLAVQEEALVARRARIDQTLSIVRSLRGKRVAGETLSAADLIELAKETTMSEHAEDTLAWKRYEQARPRTAIPVDPAALPAYAGTYRLEDGLLIRVYAEEGRLMLEVIGQSPVELFAEAADAFFMTVVPAQVTFDRDADGIVCGFVLHQEGYELPAVRAEAADFGEATAELARRAAAKKPDPRSAARLREVIEASRSGMPDLGGFTEPLAGLMRTQAAVVRAELGKVGALKSLEFKGLDPTGLDVFRVDFENGQRECGISFAPDGRVNALYLRAGLF